MALKHFIVCMRDTHIRLIGPFEDRRSLIEYGHTQNPSDDPRWQSIELDVYNDALGVYVRIYAPTDGPMPD